MYPTERLAQFVGFPSWLGPIYTWITLPRHKIYKIRFSQIFSIYFKTKFILIFSVVIKEGHIIKKKLFVHVSMGPREILPANSSLAATFGLFTLTENSRALLG